MPDLNSGFLVYIVLWLNNPTNCVSKEVKFVSELTVKGILLSLSNEKDCKIVVQINYLSSFFFYLEITDADYSLITL